MCYNNNVIKRGNPKSERKGSKMRKVRALTPSQTARQIFSIYDYSVGTREHIENVITKYNQISHPHAKIIAGRLAKKLYRADRKEFGYPLKAQSHAKGMVHYSKIKGIC